MAWVNIPQIGWEYSTTPEIDDPENAYVYAEMTGLVDGIRTNQHDGLQIYVYCRQVNYLPGDGPGWGELNKTYLDGLAPPASQIILAEDGSPILTEDGDYIFVE